MRKPAFWTMASTPGGEYILLFTGTGNGFVYDYTADDFTLTRLIRATPLTGYAGPVTAGPGPGGAVLAGGGCRPAGPAC